MSIPVQQNRPYSVQTLAKLYGFDLVSALSSSAMVSPFITVVDRAIIENMNGKRSLGPGLVYGAKMVLTRPQRFMSSRPFHLVLGLYFSTYATANIVDTTAEYYGMDPSKTSMIKFIATTAVNMSVCMYKDRSFTRMFGTVATRSFPVLSYLLFAMRDSLTVAASFNAPVLLSSWLQQTDGYWKRNPSTSAVVSQLTCPSLVQFISTPLHLLALDLYNRPAISVHQRATLIRAEYLKSAVARIGRIGPAFGFGGIGNTMVRNKRSFIWQRQDLSL
ncbi:uncharacterized protein BX664DRAFT_382050 [Halteromyces radiatus]|uniref:uncharacterized protein n=1 Tax=Halteromyces radiatus TaxID=101107 RepID=UPI002220898D|nr:uncharacterized protein BX664DRAFT_382050 [Halteromyces radiatus]KAI8099519.1 hypothetical protein BX664DRAFT_382050 [Halteromyces radiatus]